MRPRVIPCLLLKDKGLVKTVRFSDPKYVGDPINAVKIFNEKEVDELVFMDITASRQGRGPDVDFLSGITHEAFMPFSYGGGVRTLDEVKRLLYLGVEKVVINTNALKNPGFMREAADVCGSQSVIAAIDVKKDLLGRHRIYDHVAGKATNTDPVEFAKLMERNGAGEIILNSVDLDGTMAGYDLDIIRRVSAAVETPIIALGGAGKVDDFKQAIEAGASAVAAGSMFVFYGPHRAVLISYPDRKSLSGLVG